MGTHTDTSVEMVTITLENYEKLKDQAGERLHPPARPALLTYPPSIAGETPSGLGGFRSREQMSDMSKLMMRMGWGGYNPEPMDGAYYNIPFDFLAVHPVAGKMLVMVVLKQRENCYSQLCIEDDANLYPSDALCTKLRMLIV